MSLRTKLLAAVVGLHGAFLLLALYWLVREDVAGPSPAADLRALAESLAGLEGTGDRALARGRFEALRRGGRLREAYLVQESGGESGPESVRYRVQRVEDVLAGGAAAPEVVEPGVLARVLEQFRQARRGGDTTWFATVISPTPEAGDLVRTGLVATTPPAGARRSGVQVAYVVLLGGVVVLSVASFFLVSRLVTRRLARLTAAADAVARGDYRVVIPSGGSGDEIDRTLQAFQRMAREIGEYQGHLEDRVLSALGRIRKTEQHLAIAQRLAATGKLASGVAHEINNPLGGMKNAVRALARGDLPPPKQREYLDLVAEGLARVEETVKKFLSFTPRRIEPRPSDLSEVAGKALALARHRIERRGGRVVERLAEAGEAMVFGDPHELQQVALNLLLNAADAIPEGRAGVVEIVTRREGEDVLLEVTDDGVGMSPEDQARCFDLFFTTKAVGEGTGLGLAVVHNVVSNHGGRIEVDSAVDRGSTFRVVLPREAPPPAGPPDPGRPTPPSAG